MVPRKVKLPNSKPKGIEWEIAYTRQVGLSIVFLKIFIALRQLKLLTAKVKKGELNAKPRKSRKK